jgi:hypothetical protein
MKPQIAAVMGIKRAVRGHVIGVMRQGNVVQDQASLEDSLQVDRIPEQLESALDF